MHGTNGSKPGDQSVGDILQPWERMRKDIDMFNTAMAMLTEDGTKCPMDIDPETYKCSEGHIYLKFTDKDKKPYYVRRPCMAKNPKCAWGKRMKGKMVDTIDATLLSAGIPNRHMSVFKSKEYTHTRIINKLKVWDLKKPVVISGNTGTGKSVGAVWALKTLMYKQCGDPLDEDRWGSYLSRIQNHIAWVMPIELTFKEYGMRDKALNARYLVIDDLGTEDTRFAKNVSYVISRRHDREQTTIITTNLTMEELKSLYGERAYDRLLGALVVSASGDSIREQRELDL